jgi:hypothetical protein
MPICFDDRKTFFLQREIFLAGADITSTEKTPPLRHAQEKREIERRLSMLPFSREFGDVMQKG